MRVTNMLLTWEISAPEKDEMFSIHFIVFNIFIFLNNPDQFENEAEQNMRRW